MAEESLFDDFSAVSREEWLKKIEKDLRGASYGSLISHLPDNIDIHPIYMEGDADTGTGSFRRENNWKIVQEVLVTDSSRANKEALDHLNRGADSLLFYISPGIDLSLLLKDILIEHISVHFVTETAAKELAEQLREIAENRSIDAGSITGSINIDCLENLARTGNWFQNEEKDIQNIRDLISAVPENFRSVCVNANLFGNAGATLSQQLGISLAMIYEYIYRLELKSADKFWVNFAIGSDYFGEISKLRAFRRVWVNLLNELGLPPCEAHIYGESSTRNKTIKDGYNNMIRTSSEAMAAGIGGCDEFSVKGFDITFREPTQFSERIAKNQQSILQHESHVNKVMDIARGSYFIEEFTEALAKKGWMFFKEIEREGGYVSALKSGWLQEKIHASADAEQKAFDQKDKVLIGANKYENGNDKLADLVKQGLFYRPPSGETTVSPIRTKRLSEDLEASMNKELDTKND